MPNEKQPANQSKGFAITSMVCGICALVFCWTFWIGLILAIIALVFGIIAVVKKKAGKGMAIAGIATGAVGLVVTVIIYVTALSLVGGILDATTDAIKDLDDINWSDLLNE